MGLLGYFAVFCREPRYFRDFHTQRCSASALQITPSGVCRRSIIHELQPRYATLTPHRLNETRSHLPAEEHESPSDHPTSPPPTLHPRARTSPTRRLLRTTFQLQQRHAERCPHPPAMGKHKGEVDRKPQNMQVRKCKVSLPSS